VKKTVKLLGVAIAIIAILAMTVPAMAVDTSVTVISGGGGGNPPNIVASWVMVDTDATPLVLGPGSIMGDDDPTIAGTDIYPPLQWQTQKPVCYFALVDDREGDDDVVSVDVDVWHPEFSPAPYDANDYFKYERPMVRYANFDGCQNPWSGAFEEFFADYYYDQAVAFNLFTSANIGINPNTGNPYTLTEIEELIDQESVGFWAVCVWIDYEQPAGTYPVEITAVDTQTNISQMDYSFYYIPVSMVDYDFLSVNFGQVMVNVTQEIDGDREFAIPDGAAGYDGNGVLYPSPAQATVRNIGNVWSKIQVMETNLYQGGTPLPSDPDWNVIYDACLSDPSGTNLKVYFSPEEWATLCRNLYLSETQKLDFSLKFMKYGQTGQWTGTMSLSSFIAPDWPTVLRIA
jgi:hypothetical protein